MSHLRDSSFRGRPSYPPSPSQGNLDSATTISKDATHGRAGEERQILSSLAERAYASNGFGGRQNDGPPPSQLAPPSHLMPPPTLDLPNELPPPRAVRVPQSEDTDDDHDGDHFDHDDGDNSPSNLDRSTPNVHGTRSALSKTFPRIPREWRPKWSSSLNTKSVAIANDENMNAEQTGNFKRKMRNGRRPYSATESDSYQSGYASASGLTEKLAEVVQSQMRHSLLGSSHDSTMFKFLLDNIEKLEWINIALNEKLKKIENSENEINENAPASPKTAESSVSSGQSGVQVLHIIACSNWTHDHDGVTFADQPTYRESKSGFSKEPIKKLEGTDAVNDVNAYIKSRPDLSFLVFKFHVCEEERFGLRYPSMSGDLSCACRVCVEPEFWQRNPGQTSEEQIRIVSPELKRALRSLGNCRMDGVTTGAKDDPQMAAPYLFLYHHRTEIDRILKEQQTSETKHLQRLKDWLDANYGKDYDEADRLFSDGLLSQNHMIKLFKPNQVIIEQSPGKDAVAYVVQHWSLRKGEDLFTQVWSWEYDGFELTRKRKLLSLNYKSQENMPITDLKVFPLEYAPKGLVESLIRRGQKYWGMRAGRFVNYCGLDGFREEFYHNNRFMIDIKTHIRIHSGHQLVFFDPPSCVAYDAKEFDTFPIRVKSSDPLTDDLAILLPSQIPGFEIASKKWVNLNIMQIEDVTWDHKAFGRLVLDEPSKDLVRALVSVHLGNKVTGDIIAGKGNGLIILLHGSPGVGKTLTAESVAELAEKPLYRVTCGDIGNKPDEVEKYLRTVLYLGKIWDCILLMDEADVFLEERTMADLQRNSLVSVFLRTLESYDGILILTSNRVGSFDEAFKSRIQVALHYKPLNRQSRKQIWENFFEMIEEENNDVDMGQFTSRLDELAKADMNGRQIRNCLQTAQQLSKFKEEPLSWSSLSQTIKTTAKFQLYLENLQGHNDEKWAREEQLR